MAEKPSPSTSSEGVKNHRKYRRDKPWDDGSVDRWKVDVREATFLAGRAVLIAALYIAFSTRNRHRSPAILSLPRCPAIYRIGSLSTCRRRC